MSLIQTVIVVFTEILVRWDRVVERGTGIGGDIVVPEGVLLKPPNFSLFRKLWPDGEIPFRMDPTLSLKHIKKVFNVKNF